MLEKILVPARALPKQAKNTFCGRQPKATGGKILRTFNRPGHSFSAVPNGQKVIVGSQVIFLPSPPLSASSALDKKKLSSGLRSQSFFRPGGSFSAVPNRAKKLSSGLRSFFRPRPRFPLLPHWTKKWSSASGRFFRRGRHFCLLTKPTLPLHDAICLHQTHWTKSFFLRVQVPGSGKWGLGLTF